MRVLTTLIALTLAGCGADGLEEGTYDVTITVTRDTCCMMHVRRRFHRVFKGKHLGAAVPLGLIKELYEVEAKARDDDLDAPARFELRR